MRFKAALESERLVFHIPALSLAEEVLEFYDRNRQHLECWEPKRDNNFYTLDYQELMLKGHLKEYLRGRGLRFWLRSREQGILVGAVNLNMIIREPFHSCSLGYKIDGAFTGLGLMTEAVSAIIPLAFDTYLIHRIEANIIPSNVSSKRVLQKSGFSYEGLAIKYLRINGQWEDHERYALVNDKA